MGAMPRNGATRVIPPDGDGHLAIGAGDEANELLEREPLEASARQVGRAWLVDLEPPGDDGLTGAESLDDGAGELLLQGGDGIGVILHIGEYRVACDWGRKPAVSRVRECLRPRASGRID